MQAQKKSLKLDVPTDLNLHQYCISTLIYWYWSIIIVIDLNLYRLALYRLCVDLTDINKISVDVDRRWSIDLDVYRYQYWYRSASMQICIDRLASIPPDRRRYIVINMILTWLHRSTLIQRMLDVLEIIWTRSGSVPFTRVSQQFKGSHEQ